MSAPPIPVKGAGLLFRLYSRTDSSNKIDLEWDIPGAAITTITALSSTDEKVIDGYPNASITYKVGHISKLISGEAYHRDVAINKDNTTSLDWHVYKLISERTRPGLETVPLPAGSTMICVGVTPREGYYQDYADWFDEEHAQLISKVPGWRSSKRYQLAKTFGRDGVVAPFIAVHFYDQVNGLGGTEWQASVNTEWTKRVRENCSVPHFRRVWTVEEQREMHHQI
jgi:hypothetical protein